MNHWMGPVSLVGILSTAVVCGTDMFFLTIGRPALRLASLSAGTEVMGFIPMFADARMPIWGARLRPSRPTLGSSLPSIAALCAATTALRASGHRTVTQAGHHVKTIESLELTVKADIKLIQRFKTFNNKRNKSVYDVAGAVSDPELEAMVKLPTER